MCSIFGIVSVPTGSFGKGSEPGLRTAAAQLAMRLARISSASAAGAPSAPAAIASPPATPPFSRSRRLTVPMTDLPAPESAPALRAANVSRHGDVLEQSDGATEG